MSQAPPSSLSSSCGPRGSRRRPRLASPPAVAQSARPPPPARLRPLLRRPDAQFRAPAPAQSTTWTRSCSARPAAPRLVACRRAVHTPTSSYAVAASAPPPGYPVPCSSPGPVDDPDPHLLGAPCCVHTAQRLPRGATLPLRRSGRVRRRCHRLGTRRVCHCAVPTRELMVFAFMRPQARCNLPVRRRRRDGQATRNSAPPPLSWLRPPHRPCSPTHRRPLQLTPRRRTWSTTISGRGILLRLASMVSSSSSLLLLSLSPLFPLSLLLSMI